jgi:hypothetical protein
MKRKKKSKFGKKLDTNYIITAERGDDSASDHDKREVTAKDVLRPKMPGRRKALF